MEEKDFVPQGPAPALLWSATTQKGTVGRWVRSWARGGVAVAGAAGQLWAFEYTVYIAQ